MDVTEKKNFFFFSGHVACGILGPGPGIEPGPSAVKVWSLNHWTAKEFPNFLFSFIIYFLKEYISMDSHF